MTSLVRTRVDAVGAATMSLLFAGACSLVFTGTDIRLALILTWVAYFFTLNHVLERVFGLTSHPERFILSGYGAIAVSAMFLFIGLHFQDMTATDPWIGIAFRGAAFLISVMFAVCSAWIVLVLLKEWVDGLRTKKQASTL